MSVSDNVEVTQSQIAGAGRGLFARKDFQPGDVVLAVDRPLVAELDVDRMADSCAWCFQRGETDPFSRAQAASMGLPNGFIEVKACSGCHRVACKCHAKLYLAPSSRFRQQMESQYQNSAMLVGLLKKTSC
jgi:hypothetical protein